MNWQQVLEDKSLQDLPYKIELNAQGQIVMSPAKSRHSGFQAAILFLIRELAPKGKPIPECPIMTKDNVKVADVAWLSPERYATVAHEDVYSIAPEICVEIVSDCNTAGEMARKKELYFEKGALEFWLCADDGTMSFYNKTAKLERSALAPEFPHRVEL